MFKYFVIATILAVAASEPLSKRTFYSDIDDNVIIQTPEFDVQTLSEVLSNTLDLSIKPTGINFLIELISTVFQYKTSAISIAITLIEWLMSNIFMIGFGAIAIIGLCKITGCCESSIYEYVPVNQIQSLATPQVMDQAERFLLNALEQYAEKRKREV